MESPELSFAKGYALSGKIMLVAIVILFFVVILMTCIYIYVRWYLLGDRRRHIRRDRHSRRTPFVFYMGPFAHAAVAVHSRGLDASVVSSLPVFAYSPKTQSEPLECPVCLSEFEEGETGRILPQCNHTFHSDCIDMWFHSHSTCPLCRAPVEPAPAEQNRPEVVVTVSEPGTGTSDPSSSSGFSVECRQEAEQQNRTGQAVSSSSSSIGFGRKKPSSLVGVTIEVPRRNESFGDESGCDSPLTQSSFRSPMSRILSFKRMLSRDKKASVSPSSVCVVGCSSMAELDAERGGEETQ